MPGGKSAGPSIKNKATYEAIRRDHPELGKEGAARISNSALAKGYKKGVHHSGKKGKGK